MILILYQRLSRFDLPQHSYYLTCCLHNRRPLLEADDLKMHLIGLYAAYRDRGDILLHGYVVMPDHYHVLVTLDRESSISGVVRKVHSLFTRHCRNTTPTRGRIWQRRFYDHVIRDEEEWRRKLRYMHENPVRAEMVKDIVEYAWSSARFWEMGVAEVGCDGVAW